MLFSTKFVVALSFVAVGFSKPFKFARTSSALLDSIQVISQAESDLNTLLQTFDDPSVILTESDVVSITSSMNTVTAAYTAAKGPAADADSQALDDAYEPLFTLTDTVSRASQQHFNHINQRIKALGEESRNQALTSAQNLLDEVRAFFKIYVDKVGGSGPGQPTRESNVSDLAWAIFLIIVYDFKY